MAGVYTCVIRVQVSTKSGVYIRAGKSELFFPSQAGAFRRCWEHMCSCHLKLSRNHCQFSLHRPQIQKKMSFRFFFYHTWFFFRDEEDFYIPVHSAGGVSTRFSCWEMFRISGGNLLVLWVFH